MAQVFPGLTLSEDVTGRWVVRGNLSFRATFGGTTIEDAYEVLIRIPKDYPNSPPSVQETGGRIPATFHQYSDRSLCLGAPVEVSRRFRGDPRLLGFVQTMVVEYLFGYSHLQQRGTLPYGELSHGFRGILEYYQGYFGITNSRTLLALLKILAEGSYKGHHLCPCGSGKIMRRCHGPLVLDLAKTKPEAYFMVDCKLVLRAMTRAELEGVDPEVIPVELEKLLDRRLNDRADD